MEIDIKIPSVGESVTEVILANWLVADGEYVEMDQLICELESDKATLELPAERAGKLIHVAKEGDTLEIDQLVCKIDVDAKAPAGKAKEEKEVKKEAQPQPSEVAKASESIPTPNKHVTSTTVIHSSPAAAKLMKESNISEKTIHGSGVSGRITKQDVLNYLQNGSSYASQAETGGFVKGNFSRGEERKKMSTLRRTIARRLVSAKNETAMLTTFNEVDLGEVIKIRTKYKEKFKEIFGVNLGFMSFFTRAVCLALKEFPGINLSLIHI